MILQKQVKGGILLYALLMLSIFSLLLQFYLNTQLASQQNALASQDSTKAYLMAQLSLEHVNIQDEKSKRGEINFLHGTAIYQKQEKHLSVTVMLESGKEYQYSFPLKTTRPKTIEAPPTKSTTTSSENSSTKPAPKPREMPSSK